MSFDLMITNPKNLELAPHQSVTATRLDLLVYSPNCYIQIFQTQLFTRSEDQTPNRSREVKVQRATDCASELYIYIYIRGLCPVDFLVVSKCLSVLL